MLSFLELGIIFFAYVVKVEQIATFKQKFNETKDAQNEKAYKIKVFCY